MNLKLSLLQTLPLVALATGSLFPALSSAQSITPAASLPGDAAETVALTTIPNASGHGLLVAAVVNSRGVVEVIEYKDTGSKKTGIQRIGSAYDAGSIGLSTYSEVSITTLDSTHVATAVNAGGFPLVQVWKIGSSGVSEDGYYGGLSSYEGTFDPQSIAITSVSSSEAVVAARDTSTGQLVMTDYLLSGGTGVLVPVSSGVVHAGYGNLGIFGTQDNQVVVAECDSESQLKLITWEVGSSVGYVPVRQGAQTVSKGCSVSVGGDSGLDLTGGVFVSTASLASGGAIKAASTTISPSGAVGAPDVYSGYPSGATQVQVCGLCTLNGTVAPLTAEIGADGNLWFGGIGVNYDSKISIGTGSPGQSIAISAEGLTGATRNFATAVVDAAGKLQINTWELSQK